MPSKSRAQNRFVHAAAARGEKWAQKWVHEQHGHKIPNVERVARKKALRRHMRRKHR